jgi:hypothetical protein
MNEGVYLCHLIYSSIEPLFNLTGFGFNMLLEEKPCIRQLGSPEYTKYLEAELSLSLALYTVVRYEAYISSSDTFVSLLYTWHTSGRSDIEQPGTDRAHTDKAAQCGRDRVRRQQYKQTNPNQTLGFTLATTQNS